MSQAVRLLAGEPVYRPGGRNRYTAGTTAWRCECWQPEAVGAARQVRRLRWTRSGLQRLLLPPSACLAVTHSAIVSPLPRAPSALLRPAPLCLPPLSLSPVDLSGQ